MKMVYQYMVILFTFPTTSNYFHPLQNSRLVVDEDDNDKFRPERVNVGLIYVGRSTSSGWEIFTFV